MDATALRIEGIRVSLEATRWVADMEARRHVAVLAVALIPRHGLPRRNCGTGCARLVNIACRDVHGRGPDQLRALANLRRGIERNGEEARLAIDNLIRQQEPDADETQGHP